MHLAAGNHDDPAALIAKFGDTPFLGTGVSASYTVEYPQATLVVTNSWIHGSPAGYLGPDQLAWIDRTLAARPEVPAFVCVHHPPVPVGIPFLDGMILTDAAELADVIKRHPHVARVLSGHVHRDVSALFAGHLDDHRAEHVPAERGCACSTPNPPATSPIRPASCCTYSTEIAA